MQRRRTPRPTPPRSDVPLELSDEQRARLLRVKLAGLVRDLTGLDSEPGDLGAACAVTQDGTAYVLTDGAVARGAGRGHHVEPAPGRGAGRAVRGRPGRPAGPHGGLLRPSGRGPRHRGCGIGGRGGRRPFPGCWTVRSRIPSCSTSARRAWRWSSRAASSGARCSAWRWRAWWCGRSRWAGTTQLHLEAGVGRFDRDAVAAMHQGEDPTRTLARAVGMVRDQRRGGVTHPLALLARERWLRSELVADPSPVGAVALRAVETTVERESVRESSPAAALGTDADGRPVLVVCSIGVDLAPGARRGRHPGAARPRGPAGAGRAGPRPPPLHVGPRRPAPAAGRGRGRSRAVVVTGTVHMGGTR